MQSQTLLSATACAASGAATYTSAIDVRGYRTLSLDISVNPQAASNVVEFLPLVSNVASQESASAPAAGADSWYGIGITDGVPTATALGGAVASGADYTATPSWSMLTFHPMTIRTRAVSGGSDEIRMRLRIDVSDAMWFQMSYAEAGSTGSPSTVTILYSLSV